MNISRANIETLLIALAAFSILFYTAVDYFRGQSIESFMNVGKRHTSAEAQCDCESENEIRRHLNMPQILCDYGTCAVSPETKQKR